MICVNEYFDTIVDNDIIAESSIHGQFIKRYYQDIDLLDRNILYKLKGKDFRLNESRKNGKKRFYPIGTTIEIDEGHILTALTRFDDNNRAYLKMENYLNFMNDFWNEIDKIHNSRIINIPLMGTGLTRISSTLTKQDFLEQIVWSLKTSNLILNNCRIRIIINENDKSLISLFKLKKYFS